MPFAIASCTSSNSLIWGSDGGSREPREDIDWGLFRAAHPPPPAHLLDAVVELVRVAVGVIDVGVPVGARHVAAGALQAHALLRQPLRGRPHLGQAADLPGDLVNRDLAVRARRVEQGPD